MDYWNECISEAFDDAGISATKEQIKNVAISVQGGHENYGMAFGYDAIPNPLETENKRLKKQLTQEKEKVFCDKCRGSGRIIMQGPSHSSESECYKCRGEGRHAP